MRVAHMQCVGLFKLLVSLRAVVLIKFFKLQGSIGKGSKRSGSNGSFAAVAMLYCRHPSHSDKAILTDAVSFGSAPLGADQVRLLEQFGDEYQVDGFHVHHHSSAYGSGAQG